MPDKHTIWRFVVDSEKAVRRGVSVEDVNRQLEMAMGGFKLGDAKLGHELEPRYIILQSPLGLRSEINRLGEIPVRAADGKLIPLGELGKFIAAYEDTTIFHKDLRPVEYVTGEVSGRLAAPVYGMMEVSDLLENYTAPDGVKLEGFLIGPPPDDFKSAFEWTGEWTVTYETFRDMGLAFMAALILIYMLVVWEFGNFRQPGIIMAPIPLTLIGIIPGHWLFNAEFTATSMIGWIALAGIIVRNSILLVDFSKTAILEGMEPREAVIQACCTRTRPIIITALALVAGSFVILSDYIFQGMAISLMFGGMVSTLLTLLIIPLSCLRSKKAFAMEMIAGDLDDCATCETDAGPKSGPGLLGKIGGLLAMGFYLVRAIFIMAWMGLKGLFGKMGAVGNILSMVFYGLRALPFFIWMMIKELGKGIKARFSPAPAPVQVAGNTPAATVQSKKSRNKGKDKDKKNKADKKSARKAARKKAQKEEKKAGKKATVKTSRSAARPSDTPLAQAKTKQKAKQQVMAADGEDGSKSGKSSNRKPAKKSGDAGGKKKKKAEKTAMAAVEKTEAITKPAVTAKVQKAVGKKKDGAKKVVAKKSSASRKGKKPGGKKKSALTKASDTTGDSRKKAGKKTGDKTAAKSKTPVPNKAPAKSKAATAGNVPAVTKSVAAKPAPVKSKSATVGNKPAKTKSATAKPAVAKPAAAKKKPAAEKTEPAAAKTGTSTGRKTRSAKATQGDKTPASTSRTVRAKPGGRTAPKPRPGARSRRGIRLKPTKK
jgi:hypothetical protein